MNLSYEDYKKFGGKVDSNAFPLLWLDCKNHLKTITFGRLKELDDNAKRLAVRVIDSVLVPASNIDFSVSSYSNGIESITYNTSVEVIQNSIVNLAKQYLDNNLLYRGAVCK